MRYIPTALALFAYWAALLFVSNVIAYAIFDAGTARDITSGALSFLVGCYMYFVFQRFIDKGIIRTLREEAFERERAIKERLNSEAP